MKVVAIALIVGIAGLAVGQSLNVDIEIGFGTPGIGFGVPSDSFAGVGLAGRWNGVFSVPGWELPLVGLDGQPTAVRMISEAPGNGSGGGFNFVGNTGDYRALLNDGTQLSHPWMRWTFVGLEPGSYTLYTYAVKISGEAAVAPIEVLGSTSPNPQVVTGPMPGNSLAHLITHARHDVVVTDGRLQVTALQGPPHLEISSLNGFQLVQNAVPEPAILLVGIPMLHVVRCSRRRKPANKQFLGFGFQVGGIQ